MTVDLNTISLLGIDVGYSESKATTGLAWSALGEIHACRTYTDAVRRLNSVPVGVRPFALIAIDGPLVPKDTLDTHYRHCERLFVKGAYQKRCKPGLSHIGRGKTLRAAATDCLEQFLDLAVRSEVPFIGPWIRKDKPVIEAFPNAFLGVLVQEASYSAGGWKKRGKFDWLYEQVIEHNGFHRLLDRLGWENRLLLQQLVSERDHEKRAALVCLLTAASAATGLAVAVGDDAGGWFWLPPHELWAPWVSSDVREFVYIK